VPPIVLNPEQELAVTALLDFIADPDPESPFFVLKGFAGTGKTFIMRTVIERCSKSAQGRFAFTSPTNKAAKVLRSVTGSACTIYSLLGLRIEKNGELKTLTTGEKPADLSELDVIFLDEASMVNRFLFKLLGEIAGESNLKIVFMGDAGQLPPVGEAESPVWAEPNGAALTKVMRHDNQILTLVTAIREQINSWTPSIVIASDNADGHGVWKCTKDTFKKAIMAAAEKGAFGDGSKGKVIAWRNVRVAEYNDLIRYSIFGAAAKPGHYLVGDRVVATGPCKRNDDLLLSTDDEALVEGVIETVHPMESKYKAIELKCRTETNTMIRLLVLHPDSQAMFDNDCQELAHAAKGNPKLWKKFWNLKELFHDIKYGYAITAHRSQGSTYETVFVDYMDILYNRNRKEAFQCLYVACSRPTTKLILA
jgi:exodeoxyribonuclease-5